MKALAALLVTCGTCLASTFQVTTGYSVTVGTLPDRPQIVLRPDYWTMRDEAIRTRKPLVVGVGIDPPAMPDKWLSCRVGLPWHGWTRPTVILAWPVGNELLWRADMPDGVTVDDVLQYVQPRKKWNPYQERRDRSGARSQGDNTTWGPAFAPLRSASC